MSKEKQKNVRKKRKATCVENDEKYVKQKHYVANRKLYAIIGKEENMERQYARKQEGTQDV